jgi:site-specific recombinase XerD
MPISSPYLKPKFMLYPKCKKGQKTLATLYLRTHYQFSTFDKSLGIKVNKNEWQFKQHEIDHHLQLHPSIKTVLSECKEKIMGAFYVLSQNQSEPTLREVIDLAFSNENKKTYSVLSVFESHIADMKKRNTLKSQQSNIIKYNSCCNHLRSFLRTEMKINDVSFNRINEQLIDNFEFYLKTKCGNGHNSSMKLLQIFRKIYKIGLNNRWTSRNAFADKKITFKDTDIEVLNQQEIEQLEVFDPAKSYLQKTKDLFLFSIYSGLAYIDLQHIQFKHIERTISSGSFIIRNKRVKTGIEYMVPLFGPLEKMLNKWHPNWQTLATDTFICPKISNQKYNDYLKELMALVGIDKRVTTHIGRHTFATTIALENGVGIESVSKMLGHSKIAQTQKYAKVTSLKIERETRGLFEKLKV